MSVRNRSRVAAGAAVLLLWGWALVQLGYAQVDLPSGEWFNPQPGPSNPDVIAVERRQGNRQSIYIFDYLKGRAVSIPLEEKTADQPAQVHAYYGELAWRPALDARERQWFAFVSNRDGERDIYVSWITVGPSLGFAEPIRLPFDGKVHSPRWSPDGNRLVFVSGGQLYVETGMSSILNGERGQMHQKFNPVRLIEGPTHASDPSWSPDGTHLAFTVRKNEGGRERSGIAVVRLTDLDDSSLPISWAGVVISDIIENDKYRPSWSPEGRYLAYYISPADTSESEKERGWAAVGIAEVIRPDPVGPVTDLEVQSGSSTVIDRMVWPHPHRGPEWRLYHDAFGRELPSLLTIRRADNGSTLLLESRIDEWLNKRVRYQTILGRSAGETQEIFKDLGTTAMPGGRRLVYVVERADDNRLQLKDMEGGGQRALMMPVDRSPQTAVLRSVLFPGLGQFYKGQTGRGLLYATLEAISLGTLVYFTIERGELNDDYDRFEHYYYNPEEGMGTLPEGHYGRESLTGAVNHFYLKWEGAYEALQTNRRIQWIAGSAAAAIWLLNIYDSSRGFPLQVNRNIGEGHLDVGLRPDFALYGENGWAPGIKLTVKL